MSKSILKRLAIQCKEQENDLIKVTGLWVNEAKESKEKFMSGSVGGVRVIILKNTFKQEGDNQPDYNLYFAEQIKKETKVPTEGTIDDDIPF